MSQKLENIFKEALQNQEVPYDAAAWSAMSTKLDKAMPVAGKKPFGPKAAVIVAVGIIGAASAWYFAPSSTKPTERDVNTTTAEVEKPDKNLAENTNAKNEGQTAKEDNLNSDYTLDLNENNNDGLDDISTANPFPVVSTKGNPSQGSGIASTPSHQLPTLDPKKISSPNAGNQNPIEAPLKTYNTKLPIIDNFCQYSSRSIENNSDVRIYIEFPSGKQMIVQPRIASIITFEEAGGYRIYNAEGKETSFFVYDNAAIDFTIDEVNSYKNGLPSKEVKLSTPVESAEWSSSVGNQYYTGSQANFKFFSQGVYTVKVKTTNSQGCSTTTSKEVTVKEDYNLLATTAFKPNDLDPKVNRFMPMALKDRATDFTLIIIDPKDGTKVYETSDASAGWDGIDRRNGNPAANGSNYIWKVVVNNAYPGEKNEYKGVFTVILN